MLFVQVMQGVMEGIFLFLIASGLTLIFGVSRIVNFAHGSFYMVGAFLTYQIYPLIAEGTTLGFFASIVICGLLVAVLGLLFEVFLLRRVYHAEELMQLVLTLAAVLIIRDATKFIWGLDDVTVSLPDALSGAAVIGGTYLPTYQLVMVGVGVVVLAVVWGFLKFTHAGIILRAATDDRGMVALLGINQAHVFSSVFAIGCFLAGIAGGFAAAFESINYLLDTRVIVLAFIVVVIGGLGNLYGALYASLAVGILKALGLLFAPRLVDGHHLSAHGGGPACPVAAQDDGLTMARDEGTRRDSSPAPQRRDPYSVNWRLVLSVVVLQSVLLVVSPPLVVFALIEVMIFALYASALNLLLSFSGMVSFGHAVYFGLGAYGLALSITHFDFPIVLGIIAGPWSARSSVWSMAFSASS